MFSDTNDSGLTKGNVIYVDKTNGNVKADTFTNIGLYGNGATTF